MGIKVELTETEVQIVEYAVQQYINKVQESLATEYSGVGRLLLESNIIYAKELLAKLEVKPENAEPVLSVPDVEG